MGIVKKSVTFMLALLLVLVGTPLKPLHAAVNDYMSVSKSVNPTSISTEQEAEVSLSIKGTPPVNVVQPNDVILIIDKSGSMRPEYNNGEDKITAAKEAAKGFIDLMDFSKHRVGVVDFSSTSTIGSFPLTTNAAEAKSYIDKIYADGGTATGAAIDKAIALLENHRPEAQPVIVIMTDGDATEPQGNAYQYAKERAQVAKEAGIIFYTIALLKSTDNPDTSGPNLLLKEMATTAAHHHFVLGSQGLEEIYAAIVKEIGLASAYDVTVTDVVGPDFEIVPGSYENNIPKPEVTGNTLVWKFAELKNDTLTFTYKIRPKDPDKTGFLPITKTGNAIITYKDYAGANRSKSIPNVNLKVTYPAPIVTSIEPSYGHPDGGETVVIKGDKFRPNATVKFGDFNASNVIVISANEITAVTPPGKQGSVVVKVTNPDGQYGTIGYSYKTDPIVTSIDPNNGPLAGGNTIYFNGKYFMNGITVTIGGKPAPVTVFTSSTYFRVTVPEGDAPGAVDVVLTNPDGTTVTVPGGYTYNAPPVEEISISYISPTTGELKGGELVFIQGKKFDPAVKVYFGEKEAAIHTYYSADRVAVIAPAGDAAGVVDVKAVNPDGKAATLEDAYTYKPAPVLPKPEISSITPNSGLLAGGNKAVISGKNFQSKANVFIGPTKATVTYLSSSQINIDVPAAAAPGEVDVKVVNPDNQEAVLPLGYTYLEQLPPEPPVITNINPASGPQAGGTDVYIDGKNFENGLQVYFGGQEATIVQHYSKTRVLVKAPASNVAGPVDVKIVNPNGDETVKTEGYTYIAPPPPAPPSITKIYPASGPMEGGTDVYIDGKEFASGLQVYFGGIAAPVTQYYSKTRILVKAPASSVAGPVEVKIVNPSGLEAVIEDGYTYIAPPPPAPPSITKIYPTSGPIAGGTDVYIDGKEFASGLKVYFGDVEAPVTQYYSKVRVLVKAPASSVEGPVDVKIVNPDSQEGVLPGAFTYIAPKPEPVEITKISPDVGLTTGGELVYIDGVNFKKGAEVKFGDIPVSLDYYYSSSRVRVKAPPSNGYVGPVDITLTNPDGQTYTYPNGYTYQVPIPVITKIYPANGPMAGGTEVYIDGKNFHPDMTLTVNGTPVNIATYYNSTRFRFITPSSSVYGPVDVVVTTPDGQSATTTFTYDKPPEPQPPKITKIYPTSGPVAGGTLVYIDGTDFDPGMKVYFGDVEGEINHYYHSKRFIVKSPPAAGPGIVDIKIVNPDGRESNTMPFEYK